jgi:hypothetical protein
VLDARTFSYHNWDCSVGRKMTRMNWHLAKLMSCDHRRTSLGTTGHEPGKEVQKK